MGVEYGIKISGEFVQSPHKITLRLYCRLPGRVSVPDTGHWCRLLFIRSWGVSQITVKRIMSRELSNGPNLLRLSRSCISLSLTRGS